MSSSELVFWLLITAGLAWSVVGTNKQCPLFVSNEGGIDTAGCGKSSFPCASIGYAIALAQAGQIMCVNATNTPYACPSDGEGSVASKSLVITLTAEGSSLFDCQGKGRAFKFTNPEANFALIGITIQNASSTQGGALWSQSN